MRARHIPAMQEQIAKLYMHLERGSIIRLGGGREIVTQTSLGQLWRTVEQRQDARHIDQRGSFRMIGRNRCLERREGFVILSVL